MKPEARLGVGLALLVVYQIILELFLLQRVLAAVQGGLWGAVSWTALLILSTCLADLFHNPRSARLCPLAVIGTLSAGLALVPWLPLAKERVSARYVLLSLGISGGAFWLFHLLCDRAGVRLKPLSWWGRNPLLLYVLHYVLLGVFVLPGIDWWHLRAPAWLVVTQLAALLGILGVVAWMLYRRRIVVSL